MVSLYSEAVTLLVTFCYMRKQIYSLYFYDLHLGQWLNQKIVDKNKNYINSASFNQGTF